MVSKTARALSSVRQSRPIITNDIILPNNSGEHQRSIKRNTPTGDKDLVNKEYVDNLQQTDSSTLHSITINRVLDTAGLFNDLDFVFDSLAYGTLRVEVLDNTFRAEDSEAQFHLQVNGVFTKILTINSTTSDFNSKLTANSIEADDGFTGSFTNGDAATVTVVGGIITSVA